MVKELSKHIHIYIYMQTKPYADANKDMSSLFKKVHKKEIDKYQKAKDEIQKILKEYPELKTIIGKNFSKDTFIKLNNKLDVQIKKLKV